MDSEKTPDSVVKLFQEYEKFGLADQLEDTPPEATCHETEGTEVTPQPATAFKPPELVRILEIPRKSGYGENRKIKLDSFDDQVDLEFFKDEDKGDAAIVVRRELNQAGRLRRLQLEIYSPRLREIFREKAWKFREVNVDADPIVVPAPYHALFFLHMELRGPSESKDTTNLTREEIKLLMRFIRSKECLGSVFDKWETLVPTGRISFDILWTLFPPYEIVYFHRDQVEGCYLLESCHPALTADGGIQGLFNLIRGTHDSSRFGLESLEILIPGFQGNRDISTADLDIIPLKHLDAGVKELVKGRLIQRTRKYLELQKAAYSYLQICHGASYYPCEEISDSSLRLIDGNVKRISINSNGRLVIDQTAFEDKFPTSSPDFVARNIQDFISRKYRRVGTDHDENPLSWDVPSPKKPKRSSTGTAGGGDGAKSNDPHPSLTTGQASHGSDLAEEDMLICGHVVSGFLLDKQAWVRVHVKYLEPIEFYPDTWSTLQLDSEKKDVIYDMVTGFLKQSKVSFVGWEHVVIKKGNGLLFLLHGGPGLGKTYTAEALSEKTERPLYRITTAELGTRPDSFEERLSTVFKLGFRWRAIVLLDEADIIMAKRDQHNLDRNALVGIFLRLMEYYEGILFMTTNRFLDFDAAFNNRIHATIEYTKHEDDARRNIWRQVLQDNIRLVSSPGADDSLGNPGAKGKEMSLNVRDTTCNVLAELDCNGRDIRNIVRAAMCIANAEEKVMGPEHVLRVIKCLSRAENKAEVITRLEEVKEW